MCTRASKKIWIIRRMKLLNLGQNLMLDVYIKEIRSILEFGVVVWTSGLTLQQINQIERIQRTCVSIILFEPGFKFSYTVGCTLLSLEPLHYRRTELCIRFALKTSKNSKHGDLFTPNTNTIDTRQEKVHFRGLIRKIPQ